MSSAPQQPRSLYRRHRPRTFADVVGQEPVVRTLRNAVERDKVHHAYLFVGSRGTGKTSMAKILAACLNCEAGRSVTPCGVCESCVSIAEARSLDVIEMDAASNNSVEDIRELRDSVAYAPLTGRAKVYILDEAHMLSTAAWNAFLKTLEEPPPHTVFVLATTEAQKVPATVVDRCHRFDFQRPTVEQVATVLRRAAESESIAIPPEAVAALSRSASGSFRDALGTLEQLLTYSGPSIELPDVLAVLGVADSQLLERTIDAVAASDAKSVLLAVEECASSGRDPGAFASDLEARAREIVVVQVLEGVPSELSLTEELDQRLESQADRVPEAALVRLLDLLAAAAEAVKAGGDARTQVELALLKAAKPEVDASTKALLARIERLEVGGVVTSAGRPSRGASLTPRSDTSTESATPEKGPLGGGPSSVANGVSGEESLTHRPEASAESATPENGPSGEPPLTPRSQKSGEPVAEPTQAPAPTPAPSVAVPAPPVAVPAPPATAPAPPASVPPAPADGLAALQDLWPAIVDLVRSSNALIGAVIEETRPVLLEEGVLTLAFPSTASFNRKRAEDRSYKAAIAEAISQLAGLKAKLAYELSDELAPQALSNGGADVRSEEEIVNKIIVEFDAQELPHQAAPSAPAEEGE